MIKYQTLSLQVSNAGGLEQATAYISLLMLHNTNETTTFLPSCLYKWCMRNDMKQFTFLNTLN